jgi:hypothetical protein
MQIFRTNRTTLTSEVEAEGFIRDRKLMFSVGEHTFHFSREDCWRKAGNLNEGLITFLYILNLNCEKNKQLLLNKPVPVDLVEICRNIGGSSVWLKTLNI